MIVTIDLGSNSFRVLLYDGENHKIIDEYQEVVGMADGLEKTKKISPEAQNRVVQAVKRSIERLNYNPSDAICVTTAAMRKAKNSNEVLKKFKDECDLNFRIIDGIEEAKLTLLAIKYALKREKVNSKKFLLIDIGGGSTELIINNDNINHSKSFDLGIITLAQKSSNTEELLKFLELKKEEIKEFILSLDMDLSDFQFVATAGTPTTVAAVKLGLDFASYDRALVNGTTLTLKELDSFLKLFSSLNEKEILELVGTGRGDYIESGVFIYRAFYEILNKNISIVFDDGLREGVAINEAIKLS